MPSPKLASPRWDEVALPLRARKVRLEEIPHDGGATTQHKIRITPFLAIRICCRNDEEVRVLAHEELVTQDSLHKAQAGPASDGTLLRLLEESITFQATVTADLSLSRHGRVHASRESVHS